MSPRLAQYNPTEVVRALTRLGFVFRRQAGSHQILRHEVTRRTVSVPMHSGDVKRGLLFGILRQAGISQGEFEQSV